MRLIITIGLFVLAVITTYSYYNLSKREKESQKRVEQMRKIRETDRFIEALKFYELTSKQRKTLRGQAIAGDLEGAQKGLQRILRRDSKCQRL